MIHIKISKIDINNGTILHSLERSFKDYENFYKYYKEAKKEEDSVIMVRFYDAEKNPEKTLKLDYIMTYNKPAIEIGRSDETN